MKIFVILTFLITFTSAQLEIGAGSQGSISSNVRKCQMLHNYEKVNGEIQLQITITPPESETMVMYIMSGNPCVFGNAESSDGYVVYYDHTGYQRPVGSYDSVAEAKRISFSSLNEAFTLTGKYNDLCVFACQIAQSVDVGSYSYNYDVEIVSYIENTEPSYITHTIAGQNCYNVGNIVSTTGIIANVKFTASYPIHLLLAVNNDCGPVYNSRLFTAPKSGPGQDRVISPFSFIDSADVDKTISTPKLASLYCYFICAQTFGKSARVIYNISILELDPSQSVSFRDVEGIANSVLNKSIEDIKVITEEIVTVQVGAATSTLSSRISKVEQSQEKSSNTLSTEWIALIVGIVGIVVGLVGIGIGSYAVHQLRKKSSSKIELA